MNSLLSTIYQTQLVHDRDGQSLNPFPTATPEETGRILAEAVRSSGAERTLEVGMAYGLSTLFLCQVHEDRGGGSHIAIDPAQSRRWKDIGLLNVERAGLSHRLRFLEAASYDALPRLLNEGLQLDFAFIDGAHWFDFALVDFFYVNRMLSVGGLVAFDDLWMPAVRRVVSFVVSNLDYEVVPVKNPVPLTRRLGRVARRCLQEPFGRDAAGTKFMASNVCLLRKRSESPREWDFHRSF